MRQGNGTVTLILVGALIGAFSSTAAAAPSADAIVNHYIDAIGGKKAVEAVNSLLVRGTYIEGDEHDDMTVVRMRPFYKLVGDPDHPSDDFAEGYDGSSWEYLAGSAGWIFRTVGAAGAIGRHENGVLSILADYREQGLTLSVVGKARIADRTAWQVHVRMSDGFEQDEFVDAKTWLLIAERRTQPVHAFGAHVTIETHWGDFRKVSGVLLPFQSEEFDGDTGKVLNSFTTREAVINRKFDPSVFSPPVLPRTPVRSLVENLYVTRDDPENVIWTYRDFRRAFPDIDADVAVRTVGYQILKTGQIESATRLLKANSDDHPKSAGAAFGLGRAYQAAGRLDEARSEYERALALDPKEQRAADGLKSLGSAQTGSAPK